MNLSFPFFKALAKLSNIAPARYSKHQGSKRGYKHTRKASNRNGREILDMTNHERVVFGRATRMGITVEEYKRRFPKGRPIEHN
jgi:hypothetical protein